jgi:hypothetical protein
MAQDEEKNQVVNRFVRTLRNLKCPFHFEEDIGLPSNPSAIDKFFGLDKEQSKKKAALQNARSYCDNIGFRLVEIGSVSLGIIIYAENMSNDEAIGRSVVVLNGVDPFKEFDMRNRWAFPFYANIFYLFSSSEKAFRFRNNAQEQCKQRKMNPLRVVHVKPWCIDFQGKHVTPSKALLSGLDKEPSEIESKLFSGT